MTTQTTGQNNSMTQHEKVDRILIWITTLIKKKRKKKKVEKSFLIKNDKKIALLLFF